MTILQLILAILNAVPILDKWFQQIQLGYIKQKVENNDKAYLAAMDLAIGKSDVTALRNELGKFLRD